MEKFMLFLIESDKRAFLKGIFSNPFDISFKLVFADLLDDNNMPLEAEFLRLGASYQKNGNNWSDRESLDRYYGLSRKLQSKIKKSGYAIYGNGIEEPGTSEKYKFWEVGPNGIYSDSAFGLIPASIDDLDEELIDAIIYLIGEKTVPETSTNYKSIEVGYFLEYITDLRRCLGILRNNDNFSKRNFNYFLYVSKNLLTILNHNPELIKIQTYYYTMEHIIQLLDQFVTAINDNVSEVLNLGFAEKDFLDLASKLRSKLN